MSILFAQNSFLKIAEESTWGNAITTSVFVKLISSTLQVTQERERRTHLSVPTSGMLSGTFEGFRNAGGSLEIPAYYDGIGLFIKAALGSVATTGSSPLFTHTYTPAEDQPSLTIDFQRGSNLANSMEKFTGVKISTMTISAEAGSEMTCSFDVLAKDGATRASNITFTAPTFDQVYHYEAGDLTLGGTLSISTLAIRSFELTLDNKLDRRNLLGSKLTGEPVPTDVREVTMSITCDVTDNTLYNDSLDGNSGDVSIEFTRSAETTHRFKIILDNATIEDYNDNITAFGRVERTFTIRGYGSASDAGLTIEIKNASSSGA
tara:strand:- start:412 stop:1371 length:960 start_codon:yes stop_codon:yes gene_type:complete